MKIDKVVTIYSKFRFDYYKGKQPGMVNARLPLKCPYSLTHYGILQKAQTCKVSHYYNIKDKFSLKISEPYL